jgi:hypothetical protein
MRRSLQRANALFAFGQQIGPHDAFDGLLATRGWQTDPWRPTFVDDPEPGPPRPPSDDPALDRKYVLRPSAGEADGVASRAAEACLMVASAPELPTLYFVEWHYIDFVLSCVGSVSEAARLLGIRRSTLQRKRKKRPPAR